jgi:uncharacterized protein YpmB
MGRELRRKEAKKNGKDLKSIEIEENYNWKKTIIVFGIIIIFFVILYFVLAIFVTDEISLSKDSDSETEQEAASTVANAILASSIFKQSEDVYYVYCFDFTDQDSNVSNTVSNNLVDDKVYRVNTNDSMNKNYVSDTANKNSSSLEDLKISNPTLIKIENGKITMILSGSSEIVEHYE